MTRETKFGLLVGMGVIIFIGILVADSLSEAQRQQAASLDRAVLPEKTVNEQRETMFASRETRMPEPVAVSKEVSGIEMGNVESLRQLDSGVTGEGDRGKREVNAKSVASGSTQDDEGHAVWVIGAKPVGDKNIDSGTERRSSDRVHYVKKNESLYTIAKHYYGNGNYWRTIYEANRDKMSNANSVREGVRLVIPNRSGGEVATMVKSKKTLSKTEGQVTGEYMMYTIRSGDSLSKLAVRFYGSGRKYIELYELNRDRIDDMDNLKVGMKILVPRQ